MKLLMCSPGRDWNVVYNINPWMEGNLYKVNPVLAETQWNTLKDALSKFATIVELKPALVMQDLPDIVFTANAGFVKDNVVMLSSFRTTEREPEEYVYEKWFLFNGYTVVRNHNYSFEGAGDFLSAFGNAYFGHGYRSSIGAGESLRVPFPDMKWFPLKLKDPRFYHLDTCFCPLDEETIMCYHAAIDGKDLFEASKGKHIIFVTEEEAKQFACNAVVIGKNVFMPKCFAVADRLYKRGFEPHLFDMSEFIKAGGACKCLTLEI